jgi:hypothetical protein
LKSPGPQSRPLAGILRCNIGRQVKRPAPLETSHERLFEWAPEYLCEQRRLYVPAHCRRGRAFKVANCDLEERPRTEHQVPTYAFTEHGAIQAANVLNSPRAIAMGVYVVRAFVQLRELLASNTALARKLNELEGKLKNHDEAITAILSAIRELMNPPAPKRRPIGFTANIEEKP